MESDRFTRAVRSCRPSPGSPTTASSTALSVSEIPYTSLSSGRSVVKNRVFVPSITARTYQPFSSIRRWWLTPPFVSWARRRSSVKWTPGSARMTCGGAARTTGTGSGLR
ncbi:MAG TPA: hypothetical protein VGB42_04450 [Candidatus Thermoplasmatota archaeon]